MELFRNYSLRNSIKFVVLLKFFTYIYLIWDPNNDMCSTGSKLEMHYQHEGLLYKSNNRLLAKHEAQNDLKYPRLRDKLSDDINNMNLKYRTNNISIHDQLNKKKINDLDAYKKGYKDRYNKKKGLAKLDCYYERKLFNKIDEICELSRSMQNDKKNLKKKIYNKFGYRLILLAISPIFGVIFPVIFNDYVPFFNICTSECTNSADVHTHTNTGDTTYYKSQFNKATWDSFFYVNMLFFFTLCVIALTVIIYTLVKVVKYKRLKAGKGKMNSKEYIIFCKELLINK